MSEEIKPKKERKFLKTLGKIGEVLIQELFFRIGSNLIKRIGGKKQLPSILLLLLSFASYAAVDSIPYPVTGNKQRLGFQTTGNGLVYRGRAADTITKPSSYVDKNVKAYLLLDSVRGTIFVWRQTRWDSILVGGGSATFDTSSLNLVNRFALKLNISDTAAMLLPYATKSYVDTAGRFYARQDYLNVTSSTLTWTQTDTLVPSGVNVVMVYRNGQILLTSQYTIPTKTSVVIAATSFKVGENYTVIFPKGGGGSGGSGGGGGGGSGSLTSISGGTGILVSPDPITTTGTVSADLSVLMELNDTVSLSNRINTKLTATDTASLSSRINLKLNATDTASLSSRINLKLNPADTVSLSNRINLKGSGTVTSVATGYGITGGAITTTGTLLLDSAVVFSRIRDSIVDIAIGNDTIKIIKQEYAPALSSVLTFTVLPKFPIQLKAFILVFRNGQLLNNEQYNLTDTNKITIVSSSFKLGSNYTVVTVSGIGSVSTGVFPNPVYPEAGIALSTGSAWASSIPNNSANWNIAFNDKIANAAFTGTTTKTLTLTQTDGGTLTAPFTDLQGVTGVTAGTGLTGGTISTTGTVAVDFGVVAPLANPTFTGTVSGVTKSMVELGNVDNTSDANKPISTATQTALNGKLNLTGGTLTGGLTGTSGTLNSLKLSSSGTNTFIGNGILTDFDNIAGIKFYDGTLGNMTIFNRSPSTSFGSLIFSTGNNGSDVPFERMRITHEGNAVFSGTMAIGYPFAYKPLEVFSNPNDFVSVGVNQLGQYQWSGIHFGYREASTQYRKSAIVFQKNDTGLGGGDASGKIHILNVNIGNVFKSADLSDARLTISNNGFVGINDTTPSTTLDVNGTFNATGAATLGSTLAVAGATTLNNIFTINSGANTNSLNINNTGESNILNMYSTNNNSFTRSEYKNGSTGNNTSDGLSVGYFNGGYFVNYENTKSYLYTNNNANQLVLDTDGNVGVGIPDATNKLDVNGTLRVRTTNTIVPTSILGIDNNGVVGTVTTVAQTNLMTRGVTTFTTGGTVATFDVTHSLGTTPETIIITSDAINGSTGVFYEIIAKNNTEFRVQGFNVSNGSPATNKTLSVNWLALK